MTVPGTYDGSSSAYTSLADRVGFYLWLAVLFVIPITSSPIIDSLTSGETPVSPLALIPLLGIVLIVVVPHLVRGSGLPALFWPILLFVILAMLSACLSFSLPIFPFKGHTIYVRIVRGLLTMGIGLSFYLSSVIVLTDSRRVIQSLRFIYLGLIVLLLWSSVQAYFVLADVERMPLLVTRIHHIFSVRDPFADRVTGMAYEPSWLGDQLVVLYLPLLVSSVLRKRTVFRSLWKQIPIEGILLVWSLAILLLTQSRISFLSLLAAGGAAYLYFGLRAIRRALKSLSSPTLRSVLYLFGLIALITILILVVLASGWLLSQVDERMAAMVSVPDRLEEFAYFQPNELGYELASRLAFAERIVYWMVGLRTFSVYPIVGVGPGNTGFFFERMLPPYGLQLTEIRAVIERIEFGFPNPKNLWIRLLAEGGILGFSSYMVWFSMSALGALRLWRETEDIYGVIGLAGVLGAITYLVEGFSIDTYALPQVWVLLGIVAAAMWQRRFFQIRKKASVDAEGSNR